MGGGSVILTGSRGSLEDQERWLDRHPSASVSVAVDSLTRDRQNDASRVPEIFESLIRRQKICPHYFEVHGMFEAAHTVP